MKKVLLLFFPALLGAALVFLCSLTLVFHLRSWGSPRPNPMEDKLKGLHCELWDDPQGLSHARADHKLGALACMGYLHGRDRAWQLDYFKRTWMGRRSEVFGKSEIRSDFSMRLLGFDIQAERIFQEMAPDMQSWLWAYALGVNRGLNESKGSYEFRELGYAPGFWMPQDSIALLLLQGFDQTKQSFTRQMDENDFLEEWGAEAPRLFAREGVPWDTTILKPGDPGYPRASASPAPARRRSAFRRHGPRGGSALSSWARALGGGVGQGSNNWVIAPSLSRTGHAWLANDPHLELKHPPFWYWLHVQGPDSDMIGASLPGVPGIASGANRHVAWGVTNSYLNVTRLAYVSEKELETGARTERPWIWVRLGPFRFPFFFKTLQRLEGGWPVLPIDSPPGSAAVLRWTGYELKPEDFRGSFELQEAKSAEEADRALSRFNVPSWNFVFADDRGKIGYRAIGRVPGNAEEVPFGIRPMSLSQLKELPAFTRALTAEQMPHVMNPKRGFVATANNHQWPESAPWKIGRAHAEGFRAFRIEELIGQSSKHDLETMRRIQCDVQAMDARFLLPGMLRILGDPGDERSRQAIRKLKEWDGVASPGCTACTVFQRWIDRVLTEWDLEDTALYRLLAEAEQDDDFDRSVRQEFAGALDELRVGADGALPSWKELHLNSFVHLAGNGLFPGPSVSTPGNDQTVNPGSSEWEDGVFRHTTGASQRLIVELSQPPAVYSVLAGSNRDVERRDPNAPGSEWRKWIDCEQQRREFPLDWSKVQARRLDW